MAQGIPSNRNCCTHRHEHPVDAYAGARRSPEGCLAQTWRNIQTGNPGKSGYARDSSKPILQAGPGISGSPRRLGVKWRPERPPSAYGGLTPPSRSPSAHSHSTRPAKPGSATAAAPPRRSPPRRSTPATRTAAEGERARRGPSSTLLLRNATSTADGVPWESRWLRGARLLSAPFETHAAAIEMVVVSTERDRPSQGQAPRGAKMCAQGEGARPCQTDFGPISPGGAGPASLMCIRAREPAASGRFW